MFCPNCGADCGSGQFCSACGAEVRQAGPGRSTWVPGMPCPQCGGTELEGKRCAFCGLQLLDLTQGFQETPAEEDSFEIPVGRYYTIGKFCWLHLEKNAVTITNAILGVHAKVKVPYQQIVEVQYMRRCGKLLIRWKGEVDGQFRKRVMQRKENFLQFTQDRDIIFYHIYYLLKYLAPTATCTATIPPAEVSSRSMLTHYLDLDAYFARYNPHRSQAAAALRRDTGMGERDATALIDGLFDKRQEEQYAENPTAAVRDLNRIVRRAAMGSWIQLETSKL